MHGNVPGTVLCHGCWDLLHVGHIRHLQEAASLGQRLVVSVTSDRYVNKGAGRPRFSQEQRMEALRALECVDEVILNDAADPIELIGQLKPAVYVKGSDYLFTDLIETGAVKANGGRVHITKSQKWSSSRLINQDKYDDGTVRFLEMARSQGYRDQILGAFDQADRMAFAFVGETIIDEYRYVSTLGKASKEYVLATVYHERPSEKFDGGVVAAAKHAEWKGVTTLRSPPFWKTRYVDPDFNRKLFEVYGERDITKWMFDYHREEFHATLGRLIADGESLIVFDFGHGFIRPSTRKIVATARFLAVNAQSNAGNHGFNPVTNYSSPHLVCVDAPEARLATGLQHEPVDSVVRSLAIKMPSSKVIVTNGRHGCYATDKSKLIHIPAFSHQVVDTMGAGDAFLAVAGPLAATGLPTEMAAFAGNVAGAIKVGIVGHRRHVGRQELIATIEALLK